MSDVKRTISGEIVAEATKARHQMNEKPVKAAEGDAKASKKDSMLAEAKKELKMVVILKLLYYKIYMKLSITNNLS
jgi:hypothetical protein